MIFKNSLCIINKCLFSININLKLLILYLKHSINALARILLQTGYEKEANYICGHLSEETIETTNPACVEKQDWSKLAKIKDDMMYLKNRYKLNIEEVKKYLEEQDSKWTDEE